MSHFDNARIVDEEDLDYAPDVLILPSRLKQFAKAGVFCNLAHRLLIWTLQTIHSTTTLNPSFLSKGTYGTINLAPRSAGRPVNRLTVEVAKLEALSGTTAAMPVATPAAT